MISTHADLDTVQRYAAGHLDPASAAVLEEHLLLCKQCQSEVRLAVGVRQVARTALARSAPRRSLWIGGVSLALAAGAAVLLLVPRSTNSRLTALGRVLEPPAYLGLSVRAAPRAGDSLFAAAMDAYVARRYVAAATGLQAALAAGADSIPAEFFLACAELMLGRARAALDGYARVIAAGPAAAPYLPEAHAYRARAWLRLGKANEGIAELDRLTRLGGDLAARARALADSVREAMRR